MKYMSITKPETDYLVTNKIGEGKSPKQAYAEVNRLMDFEHTLNKENKAHEKAEIQLIKAKQDILALREQIRIMKKERFAAKSKIDSLKRERPTFVGLPQKQCTVLHLSRVMHYLDENKVSSITKISEECLLTKDIASQAVTFLVKNKLVKEEGGVYKSRYG